MILCTEGGGIMIVSNFSSTAVPGDGRLLSCAALRLPPAARAGARGRDSGSRVASPRWPGSWGPGLGSCLLALWGTAAALIQGAVPESTDGTAHSTRQPRANPNGQACSLFHSGGVTVKSQR